MAHPLLELLGEGLIDVVNIILAVLKTIICIASDLLYFVLGLLFTHLVYFAFIGGFVGIAFYLKSKFELVRGDYELDTNSPVGQIISGMIGLIGQTATKLLGEQAGNWFTDWADDVVNHWRIQKRQAQPYQQDQHNHYHHHRTGSNDGPRLRRPSPTRRTSSNETQSSPDSNPSVISAESAI